MPNLSRARSGSFSGPFACLNYSIHDLSRTEFEGYGRTERLYRAIEEIQPGRLPNEPVGLELGTWDGPNEDLERPWLRGLVPSGHMVLTGAERAESEAPRGERQRAEAERHLVKAEREKAEAERQRAEAEHERAERLTARQRELGVDPEQV
jgi:hypothetical protein